jgi:hypothetical protein
MGGETMTPAPVNLPTIWRGCDWGPVTLKWKDANGQPINLSGWRARAESLNVNLNAVILTQSGNTIGHTTLSLTRADTLHLKLGSEKWDWIWEHLRQGQVDFRFPPFLAGTVQIKSPTTGVNGDTPPGIPDTDPPLLTDSPDTPPPLPDLPV